LLYIESTNEQYCCYRVHPNAIKPPKNLKKPRNRQNKIKETTGNLIAFTSRN